MATIHPDGTANHSPAFLRPREVLEEIITPVTSGERCVYCGKPIIQGSFHWLDDDGEPVRSLPMFGGEVQSFPSWRHADGSDGHGDLRVVSPKRRCPACGAFDTLTDRDTGYGTEVTCSGCGGNHYYDRGD